MIQKFTLSDALRWQKRVVSIIRKIETAIQTSNAVREGQIRAFDPRKLLALREQWVSHLIALKLAKQDASRPIQGDIFQLAEIKSAIAFFERVPVTHGVQQASYHDDRNIVWVAEIRAREKDGYVTDLQSQIDTLQKKIDVWNFSHSFEIDVPTEDEYSAALPDDAIVISGKPVSAEQEEYFDP